MRTGQLIALVAAVLGVGVGGCLTAFSPCQPLVGLPKCFEIGASQVKKLWGGGGGVTVCPLSPPLPPCGFLFLGLRCDPLETRVYTVGWPWLSHCGHYRGGGGGKTPKAPPSGCPMPNSPPKSPLLTPKGEGGVNGEGGCCRGAAPWLFVPCLDWVYLPDPGINRAGASGRIIHG